MRKVILLLLLAVCASYSYAQNKYMPASWGESYNPPSKSHFSRIAALHGNTYVLRLRKEGGLFQRKTNAPVLEKFDQANNLVFSKDIDIPLEGEKLYFGDFLVLKDQMVFTVMEEKEEGFINAYAFVLSEQGETSGKSVKLMRFKKVEDQVNAGAALSPDKSKAAFFQYTFEDGQFMMKYVTLLPGLKVSESQSFKTPLEPGMQYKIQLVRFENQEHMRVMLAYEKVLDKKEKRELSRADKKNPVYGDLISYNQKAGTKNITKIDQFGRMLHYIISADRENNLYIAGIFANSDHSDYTNSIRITKFNGNGEVIKQREEKFSKEYMLKFAKAKEIDKNDGFYASNYLMRSFHVSENGKALATAEHAYHYVVQTRSSVTHYYNFNEVMGFLFDTQTLKVERFFNVPKRQETKNDGGFFSSYYATCQGDKFYLVYNDSKSNLKKNINEITKPARIKKMNEAVGVVLTVSEMGNIMERRVIDFTKINEIMVPNRFSACGKETHLYAERRRGDTCRMGKITL